MDVKDRGSNLVPGRGRPLDLDQLRKLSAGNSPAAHAARESVPAAKTRRIRRAARTRTGAIVLGAALFAAGALALLDRGALPISAAGDSRPAPPDLGLSEAERDGYWALAAREPGRFPALLGVPGDDPAVQERNAHRFERLLSGR